MLLCRARCPRSTKNQASGSDTKDFTCRYSSQGLSGFSLLLLYLKVNLALSYLCTGGTVIPFWWGRARGLSYLPIEKIKFVGNESHVVYFVIFLYISECLEIP